MADRSVLYLGDSDFAAGFCNKLEAYGCCGELDRYNAIAIPDDYAKGINLIFFEPGAGSERSGPDLQTIIASLGPFPIVAVVSQAKEHRGIAAVNAGAHGYLCADDAGHKEIEAVISHAIQRHHLLTRLSETDSTVLSILKSINDGAIVVDSHGHVLDINPAARSILGLTARQQTNTSWAKHFCSLAADGQTVIDHDNQPLVKACRGQRFSNQVAAYQSSDSLNSVLSINGQGLFDNAKNLVGGVITFRDVTDIVRRTDELELNAQNDDLTDLPNRRLFIEQLKKAMGRSQRNERPLAVLFITSIGSNR